MYDNPKHIDGFRLVININNKTEHLYQKNSSVHLVEHEGCAVLRALLLQLRETVTAERYSHQLNLADKIEQKRSFTDEKVYFIV